jgi:TatD family-associated radical SAM protein
MDWAYRFRDPERLYLNVTNRCTNRCGFCVRYGTPRLGDGMLWGGEEPDLDGLMAAIDRRGGAEQFREIVWCGFGEPTIRLDLILAASPLIRDAGATVRLNTNGHACLIHGRDVLPELGAVIDRVSVSLNAPTAIRYLELCRPDPPVLERQPAAKPIDLWDALLDFLARAPDHFDEVQASVVGYVLDDDEIEACRRLAAEVAGVGLRVR